MREEKTKKPRRGETQALPEAPLSVLADGAEGDLSALLDALPEHSEVLGMREPPREQYPGLRFDQCAPHGRFVLPAGTSAWNAAAAADFCKRLAECEADAVFYPSARAHADKGAERALLPCDPVRELADGFAPRRWNCALRVPLYEDIQRRLHGVAPDAGIPLLAALLCENAAITREPLFAEHAAHTPAPTPDADAVAALVRCFNASKTSLTAARYRFAFDYVCGRVVAAHALLAKARDRAGLRDLDEFLKKENMALRVAAAERAPLNLIAALRKREFNASPLMLPAILLALAAEKKQ